jgi:hypothetical protein
MICGVGSGVAVDASNGVGRGGACSSSDLGAGQGLEDDGREVYDIKTYNPPTIRAKITRSSTDHPEAIPPQGNPKDTKHNLLTKRRKPLDPLRLSLLLFDHVHAGGVAAAFEFGVEEGVNDSEGQTFANNAGTD